MRKISYQGYTVSYKNRDFVLDMKDMLHSCTHKDPQVTVEGTGYEANKYEGKVVPVPNEVPRHEDAYSA